MLLISKNDGAATPFENLCANAIGFSSINNVFSPFDEPVVGIFKSAVFPPLIIISLITNGSDPFGLIEPINKSGNDVRLQVFLLIQIETWRL